MPLSKPCPGMERKVMALACVAITERPMVPQPMDRLPLRYVLRLLTWRVRQDPYVAMPSMVPRRTTQSTRFTRNTGRRRRGARRRARTTRSRTGRRCARYGIRAHPAARSPRAGRAAAVASLAQRDEIGKQPIRSGHSLRELAKPGEARVDEISL